MAEHTHHRPGPAEGPLQLCTCGKLHASQMGQANAQAYRAGNLGTRTNLARALLRDPVLLAWTMSWLDAGHAADLADTIETEALAAGRTT